MYTVCLDLCTVNSKGRSGENGGGGGALTNMEEDVILIEASLPPMKVKVKPTCVHCIYISV